MEPGAKLRGHAGPSVATVAESTLASAPPAGGDWKPAFTSLPIEAILARFEYVRPPLVMEGRRQRVYERCANCRRPYCDKYEPCGVCVALDKLLTAKGNHDTR